MLRSVDEEKHKDEIAMNDKKLKIIADREGEYSDKNLKLQQKEKQRIDKQNADEIRGREQTLNAIKSLSSAKTAELAAIGKSASIADATIKTYQAANVAMASVPFPFNIVAAALTTAAGLVNVANIAGVPLATGMTQVPPGFNNDTFPARLSSGERVVSTEQNRDLTSFIASNQGLNDKMDTLINVIVSRPPPMVSIGGDVVVDAIRNEIESGRSLAL